VSRAIQARAVNKSHWLKDSEWWVETTSGLPQALPVPAAIMIALLPVLILGKIFVCSDVPCDLDAHQDLMLL
jgi:hypothetical protein